MNNSISVGCGTSTANNEIEIGREGTTSWTKITLGNVILRDTTGTNGATDNNSIEERIATNEGEIDVMDDDNANTVMNAKSGNNAQRTNWAVVTAADNTMRVGSLESETDVTIGGNAGTVTNAKSGNNAQRTNYAVITADTNTRNADVTHGDNKDGNVNATGNIAQATNYAIRETGHNRALIHGGADTVDDLGDVHASIDAADEDHLVEIVQEVIDDSQRADADIRALLGLGAGCTSSHGGAGDDGAADCDENSDLRYRSDVNGANADGNLVERINFALQQIGGATSSGGSPVGLQNLEKGLLTNLDSSLGGANGNLVAAINEVIADSEFANAGLRDQLGVGFDCNNGHDRGANCTNTGDSEFDANVNAAGNLAERVNAVIRNIIGADGDLADLQETNPMTRLHVSIGDGTIGTAANTTDSIAANRNNLVSAINEVVDDSQAADEVLAADIQRTRHTLGISADGQNIDTDANVGGNLAERMNYNSMMIRDNAAATEQMIQQNTQMLTERMNAQNDQLSAGIAMAAALGAAPALLPGKTLALDLGLGGYNGQNAIAVGLNGRLNENTLVNAGAAVGTSDASSKTAYRVGLSWQW